MLLLSTDCYHQQPVTDVPVKPAPASVSVAAMIRDTASDAGKHQDNKISSNWYITMPYASALCCTGIFSFLELV